MSHTHTTSMDRVIANMLAGELRTVLIPHAKALPRMMEEINERAIAADFARVFGRKPDTEAQE